MTSNKDKDLRTQALSAEELDIDSLKQDWQNQQANAPTGNSGYPPPQGGYPPPQGGYPPPQGGYPPPQGGYPPPQGGYPPPQGGYPPPQGGYPPPQGGYPPPQGGYPPTQGGYPPPQGQTDHGGEATMALDIDAMNLEDVGSTVDIGASDFAGFGQALGNEIGGSPHDPGRTEALQLDDVKSMLGPQQVIVGQGNNPDGLAAHHRTTSAMGKITPEQVAAAQQPAGQVMINTGQHEVYKPRKKGGGNKGLVIAMVVLLLLLLGGGAAAYFLIIKKPTDGSGEKNSAAASDDNKGGDAEAAPDTSLQGLWNAAQESHSDDDFIPTTFNGATPPEPALLITAGSDTIRINNVDAGALDGSVKVSPDVTATLKDKDPTTPVIIVMHSTMTAKDTFMLMRTAHQFGHPLYFGGMGGKGGALKVARLDPGEGWDAPLEGYKAPEPALKTSPLTLTVTPDTLTLKGPHAKADSADEAAIDLAKEGQAQEIQRVFNANDKHAALRLAFKPDVSVERMAKVLELVRGPAEAPLYTTILLEPIK